MVGVGGRSKACENCKKRRVKCDLSTPQCGRCIKARLKCGGPQDITIITFQGATQSFRSAASLSKINCDALRKTRAYLPQSPPDPKNDWGLTLHQDEIFIAFTNSQLLPAQDDLGIGPGPITAESFLALAATYFGIKRQDKGILQYGFKRYTNSLAVVHSALMDPYSVRSFDLLESVMIMALIEFLISERQDGWINHARGLEGLFALQGPQSMARLPYLKILERTRAAMVFAAIILRKPTLMSEPEWQVKPWWLHPERIDSLKLLFDILTAYPELCVKYDDIAASDSSERWHDVLHDANVMLQNLEQWESVWASEASHIAHAVPATGDTPSVYDQGGSPTPAWSTTLQYKSLYHANVLTIFHASLVLILRFIISVEARMGNSYHDATRQRRITTAGYQICRGIRYHQEKQWGEQGHLNVLFPLRLAYEAVGRTNPEVGLWIQAVLHDNASGRKGIWKSAASLLQIRARSHA